MHAHGERVQPRLSLETGRTCLPLHICPRSEQLSLFPLHVQGGSPLLHRLAMCYGLNTVYAF